MCVGKYGLIITAVILLFIPDFDMDVCGAFKLPAISRFALFGFLKV